MCGIRVYKNRIALAFCSIDSVSTNGITRFVTSKNLPRVISHLPTVLRPGHRGAPVDVRIGPKSSDRLILPRRSASNGSACTFCVVVNRCEAISYIARENVLIRSSDPKKLDAKTGDSRYKRVYPSTRSTTPLRVSSGNKLDARSLPPFPISCTMFGRIECEVQNWTNRRSRFRHS